MSKYRSFDPEVISDTEEYFEHIMAMTGERLDSKSEIAMELTSRDLIITELRAVIELLSEKIEELVTQKNVKAAPTDREILVYRDDRWNFASWTTPDETDVKTPMFIDRDGFCMDGFTVWCELPYVIDVNNKN